MITAAILLTAFLGAGVEIGLAPDQPVPHVYVDDPLIIEFRSAQDRTAKAGLEIKPDFGAPPVTLVLGDIVLKAQGTQWRAINDAPPERGRYWVHTRIESGGEVAETATAFCRVDRPVDGHPLPVSVSLRAFAPSLLQAAKDASVCCVRLEAGSSDLADRVSATTALGLQVAVQLDMREPDACEALAKALGDRVARWDLPASAGLENGMAAAKALRRGGAKAPISVTVKDPGALSSMLGAGAGQYVGVVLLDQEWPERQAVDAVRAAAERAGYEGLPLHVAMSAAGVSEDGAGSRFCRQYLISLSAGADAVALDSEWMFGGGLGPAYPYLNALARRLSQSRYVGELPSPGPAQGCVFQEGPGWAVAAWNAKDGPAEVSVKVDGATNLALYDGRNNPLPAPVAKDGVVSVKAGAEPCWLVGVGGTIVADVARCTARKEAAGLMASEEAKARLAPEAFELIKKFASDSPDAYNRLDFLSLLKVFPRIEEMWHSGALPRTAAVPLQAALGRLARRLCAVEQERAEPFLEPLQSTLANCGQFQSLYLTSSSGPQDGRERADWLCAEVGRLMAEAERVAAEGRSIEACGVAALAEWRARSLDFAKKAQPLSAPEKEIKLPEPAPPAAPAAQDKAKKVEGQGAAQDDTDKTKKPTTRRRRSSKG